MVGALKCVDPALYKLFLSPLSSTSFAVKLFPSLPYLLFLSSLTEEMDFNPFKENSNFVGLLNSQQNVPFGNFTESVSQSSPQVPVLDSHGEEASEKCKERRTWTPSDDVQLISSWLNTSKDPVVGNEQRSSAFWTSLQSTHRC